MLRYCSDNFTSVVVPKHEKRGLSIEWLGISLYAKGLIFSDIGDELRDIYRINLSIWITSLDAVQ